MTKRILQAKLLRPYEEFGEWIFQQGTKDVISHDDLADQIYSIRKRTLRFNGQAVPKTTKDTLASWIAGARIYLRRTRQVVVWNVQGKGWRIGTDHECAVYGLSWLRRLISTAETTKEYASIIKRGEIDRAIRVVFPNAEDGIAQMLRKSREFRIGWDKLRKEQRDEQKKALPAPAGRG